MAAITHPVITPAEFCVGMERAGWRAPLELINGEVVIIPPAGGDASLAQTEVVHRLRVWRDSSRGAGRVLTDVFVRIGEAFLAPDVAWWAAGREPAIGPGAIGSVPDLVVDVLSPATRENDVGPKRERYVGAGVKELWLVDPASRSVLVVEASLERWLRADEELETSLLPGFSLPARDLFV